MKGRATSKVLTSSLAPVGRAYSRALKAEKSYSPPFPIGGGGSLHDPLTVYVKHQYKY